MLLVLAAFAHPAIAQETIAIGSTLPMKSKALPTVSGTDRTIASVKGEKGTLVVFWCNTCPWVQRYENRLIALANAYSSKGIGIIAINSNDPVAYPGDALAEMKKQAQAASYPFAYASDAKAEVAAAFGAKRTPQAFLFNASDALVYQGAIDDSPSDADHVGDAYLATALDAVLSGADIAVTETKAFGCTIKFQ